MNTCVPEELWGNVISLTASDGIHLSGLVLGDGPDGVLLSHEQGYSICSFLPLARQLADLGFQVILPEYRLHGASETVEVNEHFYRDGRAALDELHRRGAERIFLGGASCGGTVSAMLAGQKQHVPYIANLRATDAVGDIRFGEDVTSPPLSLCTQESLMFGTHIEPFSCSNSPRKRIPSTPSQTVASKSS